MKLRKILATLAAAVMLGTLPALSLAETGYGSAAVTAGQTYTVEQMLTYAIQDEYEQKKRCNRKMCPEHPGQYNNDCRRYQTAQHCSQYLADDDRIRTNRRYQIFLQTFVIYTLSMHRRHTIEADIHGI